MRDLLRGLGVLRAGLGFVGRYRFASAVGLVVAVGWFVLELGGPAAAHGGDAHGHAVTLGALGADALGTGGIVYALGVLGALTLAGAFALGMWDRRSSVPRDARAWDGSLDAWGGKPAPAPVRSSHGVGVGA